MRPAETDTLTKIRVLLHRDLQTPRGERLWAEPLGSDLYRVRNTPFFAKDLNFGDVVRAIRSVRNVLPTVTEVVSASGHRTLRVAFAQEASPTEVADVLKSLESRKATHERARGSLFAIDVEPEADYQDICDYLWQLEQRGVLEYETGATATSRGSN